MRSGYVRRTTRFSMDESDADPEFDELEYLSCVEPSEVAGDEHENCDEDFESYESSKVDEPGTHDRVYNIRTIDELRSELHDVVLDSGADCHALPISWFSGIGRASGSSFHLRDAQKEISNEFRVAEVAR